MRLEDEKGVEDLHKSNVLQLSVSKHIMENDIFNVPIGIPNLNPIQTDAMYLSQPNFLGLNHHQNLIMDGFPIISTLQTEPINHINDGHHLANHSEFSNSPLYPPMNSHYGRNVISHGGLYPINNTEVPISATALASLLASRYNPNMNLNDEETSQLSPHPMEVFHKQPSIGNSINFGLDGIVGDMNSKWDFNNVQPLTELSGRIPGRLGILPHQSGWISSESTSVSSESPSGSSRFNNELSLSLATCSDMNYSGVRNLSLHEQRKVGSDQASCTSKNIFGSHKPVQVLQLLSGSGYLQMMQEILAEIASYSLGSFENTCLYSSGTAGRISCKPTGFNDILDESGGSHMQIEPIVRGHVSESNKKQLLGLLQLVDDRYNQCMDEIHTVISAFHAVTELDPQLHARFTLQTISFFYRNLRERISNHILAMGENLNRRYSVDEETFLPKQWAFQQFRRKDHQLWRPQRGLPEKSVSVLRAWMFQNFLHPYPKDAEKQLLAVKSGLTRNQVSNWFINARVRIWKPMIDEMYAEMNRRRGRENGGDLENNQRNHIGIIDGRRLVPERR